MAYQTYVGDRFFASSSGQLPTGVMDGAYGIAWDNLRQYVKYQGYWQILPIGILSGDLSGTGTTNYITKWNSSTDLGVSQIFDNGTNVGINTTLPSYTLHVDGDIATTDQFISLISTGTSPLVISSTTLVTNLNSDLLDSQEGSYYLDYNNFVNTPTIGDGTITITAGTGLSGGGTFSVNQTGNTEITLTASDLGSSQNIFKNIAVSGQSTIIADGNDDTLTFASGNGITLATNATTDTLTITNSGVLSNIAGSGISVSGATGNVTIANTGVLSVNSVTGNVTAANLLTAILTVDGSGSLLDSDLLDGQQGSYYLDYTNFTNTPTIGDGLITITAGTGLSGSNSFSLNDVSNTTITLTNTGVLSNIAGSGISVSGATGNVTVTNTDRGSSQNIFKNIVVTGQTSIVADSNNDSLTVASGSGITLTTNATTDTLTITNSGVTSNIAGSGISVSGATGAITISNTGVLSVNGVTGAVTAANLLTALLTVDGSGSLLDSDLLDGQQGSYYLDYNNFVNTPTIGDGLITITAGTGLSGGGTFNLNDVSGTTITLNVTDLGSSQNIFKTIAVSGQSSIVADSNSDTLTIASGAGITLTTNATTDTLTITANIGNGTANYIPRWSDSDTLTNSNIYDDGTNIGIGTTSPSGYKLNINGSLRVASDATIVGNIAGVQSITASGTITLSGLATGTDNTVLVLNSSNQVVTDEIDSRVWGTSLVDGSGTTNYISFWSDSNTITGESNLYWDSSNNRLGINNSSPSYNLDLIGNAQITSTALIDDHAISVLSAQINTTPTNGYLIKTGIPFAGGFQMPTVIIEGYSYGSQTPMLLHIVWYVYNGAFTAYGYTNLGGWNPSTVSLSSHTDGSVCIHLSANAYYNRFNIRVIGGGSSKSWLMSGWSFTDAISPTNNKVTVPQKVLQTSISGNSDTVDSLHASSFLRSDADDTGSGNYTFSGVITLTGTTASTDNTVLILDSSNRIKTDEIDPRVWGTSLIDGNGTANYIPKWSDNNTLTDSVMYETASKIGINTTTPDKALDINGGLKVGTDTVYGQIVVETAGAIPSGYEGSVEIVPWTTPVSGTTHHSTRFVNKTDGGTTIHDVIVEGSIGAGDLFQDNSNLSYNLEVEGTAGFSEYIYHRDDNDTFVRFTTSTVEIQAALNKFTFSGSGLTHDGGIYDLGTSGNRWENAYLGSIYANATIEFSNLTSSSETRFLVASSTGILSYRTTLPAGSVTGLDIFKNIAVSGQTTISADSQTDTLTFASGSGITLTTNATTDTLTIANSGVLSNIAGSGISVSGATGAVTISNTGVLSVNGVTGAVTAGNLLTALLTVDGSGSGLDADTVDGINAASLYSNTAVAHTGPSSTTAGWYTIATNTGDRAIGRFGLNDSTSGLHQSVVFYASHKFGLDASNVITVLHNSKYSGTSPFRYIRIKEGTTYEGAVLQVYVGNTLSSPRVYLLGDNFQSSGWVLKDWIPDATDPSDVDNYGTMTVASQVDLDLVVNGGIITTGDFYGGGSVTQYKLWHSNNDGASSGLDSDLLDGQQGSYYLDYTNFTNTPTIGDGTITIIAGTGLSGGGTFDLNDTGNTNITLNVTDVGSSQYIFKTIAVSGQTSIVADSNSDTLTIASGSGISLTTNATTDTLTIANSGVLSVNGVTGAVTAGNLLTAILTVDGSGSGLDADTLDGVQGSSFLRSDTPDTSTGFIDFNGGLSVTASAEGSFILRRNTTSTNGDDITHIYQDDGGINFVIDNDNDLDTGNFTIYYKSGGSNNTLLHISPSDLQWRGHDIWHSNNDGSGSGLDADTLDGVQGASYLRSDIADIGTDLTLNSLLLNIGEGLKFYSGGSKVGDPTLGGHQPNDTRIINLRDGNPSTDGALIFTYDITTTNDAAGELIYIDKDYFEWKGNTIWHEGNDGSGSGLDADLLDGVQGSSFLRSDISDTASGVITFDSASAYPITINGTNDAKIVLAGSSNPYIRFREGATDRAYIVWNSSLNGLVFGNQEGPYSFFYGTSTVVGHSLRTSDGTSRGFLYATSSNDIGILDEGGAWAIRHTNNIGSRFYDNATERFSIGSSTVTGLYGTIEVKDGSGKGGYDGYTIQDGSTYGQSFMSNGTYTGLFDGNSNHFRLYYDDSAVYFRSNVISLGSHDQTKNIVIRTDDSSNDQGVPWIRTNGDHLVLNAVDGEHVYLNWDTSGGGSGHVFVRDSVYAKNFFDRDNTSYFLNPSSYSNLFSVGITSDLTFEGTGGRFYLDSGSANLHDSKFELWPSSGAQLVQNIEFYSNLTGFVTYDNNGSGSTVLSHVTDADAPNSSGKVMRITYTSGGAAPTPGFGGFYVQGTSQGTVYQKGDIIIWRVMAKIPVGRTLIWTSNLYGTESTAFFLTSNAGTGDWKEYIYFQKIGETGTFSTTGYFYITGGTDSTFSWDVARVQANTPSRDEGIFRNNNRLFWKTTDKRFIFASGGGGTSGYIPYYTDADVFDNSGLYYDGSNFGIGTTSPAGYKLNINGSLRTASDVSIAGNISAVQSITASGAVTFSGLGTGTDNSVVILNSSNQLVTDEIDSRVWGSSLVDGSGTANYLSKWSDGNTITNSVIYDDGTNIGIGNTSPSYKIHVTGTGHFTSNLSTAGNFTETSSLKYKENISNYSVNISRFKQLNPVKYTRKNDKKEDVGFIAEELFQIMPEYVELQDGEPESVKYSKMVTMLVSITQQMQSKIEKLEKEIKGLKNK